MGAFRARDGSVVTFLIAGAGATGGVVLVGRVRTPLLACALPAALRPAGAPLAGAAMFICI